MYKSIEKNKSTVLKAIDIENPKYLTYHTFLNKILVLFVNCDRCGSNNNKAF